MAPPPSDFKPNPAWFKPLPQYTGPSAPVVEIKKLNPQVTREFYERARSWGHTYKQINFVELTRGFNKTFNKMIFRQVKHGINVFKNYRLCVAAGMGSSAAAWSALKGSATALAVPAAKVGAAFAGGVLAGFAIEKGQEYFLGNSYTSDGIAWGIEKAFGKPSQSTVDWWDKHMSWLP